MNYHGIAIVCPICRSDLGPDGDGLQCVSCTRQYPVVCGLADLRVRPDPYVDAAEDRSIGMSISSACRNLDFIACVDAYYRQATKVPPGQAQMFKRGLMGAASRAEARLVDWGLAGSGGGSLLDLGCGTAPLLVAARPHIERVVGVDIAFRWLVVAKKRLEEAEVDVPLICACAEALPFPNDTFDCVAADSVIEHVWDQTAALAECRRVLRPGGRLLLATPNRFSLGPDPHVGLLAGGYLPKVWIDRYVQRQGGIPPHRHLLSSRGLRQLLVAARFASPRIWAPRIPPGQQVQFSPALQAIAFAYNGVRHLPAARHVLEWIGPALVASAQKPAAS
jgi:SAM-dependent methyltransferase